MIKKYFIILFVMISFLILPYSLLSDDTKFSWEIGEEFTYKVKWAFIRLGTVKVQLYDTLRIDNQNVYHVKFYIDSNPLIFFVNMHNVYDTYIDEQLRLFLFLADEKIDNITYIAEYRFNYSDSTIGIKMTSVEDPTQIISRIDPLDEKIYDGATLIYYTRKNLNTVKNDTVIAFFESKRGKVAINFRVKKDHVKIDAIEKSVPTYYIDGNVLMKAIAGLNGPYKGWFAMDKQRPPLKAELKVFIGHVNVELESWKNWTPHFE